jgi:hypothetical protein
VETDTSHQQFQDNETTRQTKNTMIIKPKKSNTDEACIGRSLRFTYGKHETKLIEEVFLSDPDYITWMKAQEPNPAFMKERARAKLLEDRFDARPFTQRCSVPGCELNCTRFLFKRFSPALVFVCDRHKGAPPSGSPNYSGYGTSFMDILRHVSAARLDNVQFGEMVRGVAQAKGCPMPISEGVAARFFHDLQLQQG